MNIIKCDDCGQVMTQDDTKHLCMACKDRRDPSISWKKAPDPEEEPEEK